MAYRVDSVKRQVVAAALSLGAAIAFACTTETAIGPDVALDSLYIEPDSGVIVVDDTLRLTAVGVDSSGRRFAHTRVTWSASGGAITLSSSGVAIGVATGMASVSASAGGKTATGVVTVTPKPIFATSRDSVPFTGIASGPDPAGQTVTITNAGGGTLTPGVDSITYGVGATGWLQASIVTAGPDTLDLSATTSGLAINTYTATVFLGAPKATPKTIKVTLAVTVGSPTTMVIDSGNSQSATVNTAVPVKPTVLIRDQYSNPVPSVGVTFAVTQGGGAVLPVAAVTTDAAGRARVTSWTLGTAAGTNHLDASASGLTTVQFVATGTPGAPAAVTKAAGDTQAVTVNTAVPVLPTVRVTDQFGNPVESVTVTFNVALGGGGVTGGTKKTASTGLAAVGSWTLGSQAGQNTLTATPTGLSAATFSATGNPGAADSIKLNAGNNQTDTVAATLGTAYSVRIADQYGNGVPGTTVAWGVTGGGSITPSSISNGSGIATATRVLGTVAGPQGASASVGGLTGSPVNFSATATHGAATTIVKAAGDNQSAIVDSAVAIPPSAKVTDQYGNAVAGVAVQFTVTPTGFGSVLPGTPITTDTLGTATVTTWTLGPTAGSNNNTLTASATNLPSAAFHASGISGTAKNLVYVSGAGQTDTIGASLAVYSVRVTDMNSNGVQGIPVSWVVTMGGGSITASSITDVNGLATATRVLGTAVGVDSATASVGGLIGSPLPFGATALHGNPSLISKTAGEGQSATVNTAVATALQARVTDRAGNPIQSANVTFTAPAGNGTLVPASPATLATDAGGFVQITSWTLPTTARADTVIITSSGTPGATFTASGTPDVPNATQSTIADNAVSIIACSVSCTVAGNTADSVTVTVRDQFNNVISGVSVTLTAINSSFAPAATGNTNSSGVFTANLNSTVAQAKTISATGVTATAAVTVNPTAVSTTFSSVAASTSPITACQTPCVVGSTALTLTATVRDTFNNIINGASVTLGATGTSNYFNAVLQNSVSGSSAGAGTYAATYNSSTAQLKTLSATITSGVVVGENTSATIDPDAPFSVSVVNSGFSARVGTGVGTLPTYTVRDQFSNLVANFPISYTTLNSGAVSGPSSTNASGQVTLTSWVMSGAATDDGLGRMANQVQVNAGSASGAATDYGIYTYSGDASPILSGCDGCHYINWTRAAIVGQSDQDPVGYTACSGWTLVTAGNANASLIYLKTAPNPGQPCGTAMPAAAGLPAATRKILRAWINNGALNN